MFLGITFKTSLENRCTIFFDHKRAIVSHVKKMPVSYFLNRWHIC